MNYLKCYIKLVRRARNRTLNNNYTEKHHIFPKSIFGKNDTTCVLTYREHFIAHRLLAKICIKRYGEYHEYTRKMKMAIHRMVYSKIVIRNSRLFEIARKSVVDAKLGVARQDLKGKRYFGASEEKIREGIEKMRQKKTGMKVQYPLNRNSPPCSDSKKQQISHQRKLTKYKFINMSPEEFIQWVSKQTLICKDGRKNPNVTRAIKWRGEEIDEYFRLFPNE